MFAETLFVLSYEVELLTVLVLKCDQSTRTTSHMRYAQRA
jgi:hypothetical protein